MTTDQLHVPNHHAHYPDFAGPAGFLAAASMVLGGGGNARLAERLSELAASDAVADIGCGPGTAARGAARLGASVVGVDPAPVMLRLARLVGIGRLVHRLGTPLDRPGRRPARGPAGPPARRPLGGHRTAHPAGR